MATPAPARAGSPAAACHSLVVRLPEPADPAALRRAMRDHTAPSRPARLWHERLPCAAGSAAARERLRAEARRPLHASRPLRVLLLTYPQGPTDLVLVARRPEFTGEDLAELAAALRTAAGGEATAEEAPRADELSRAPVAAEEGAALASLASADRSVPPWGSGEPARAGRIREAEVVLPAAAAGWEPLLAATGLVLHRWHGGEATVPVGVLDHDGPGRLSVRRVPVDEQESAAAHLDRWRDPEQDEPEGADAGPPPVAVTRTGPGRLPCLAPPVPLTLQAADEGGGFHTLRLRYDEAEICPEAAGRLVRHVARAAGLLAGAGERPLSEVPLLTRGEAAQVLRTGTGPVPAASSTPRTLHGAFARIARSRPDAVAVTAGETELSYAALDARADRAAAGLRALGVEPGGMVGVALERDADLVVTLLAVLKAGCAYVPMDVRYPEERLRNTVRDAGVVVLVAIDGTVPDLEGVRVVSPDALDGHGAGQEPPAAPEPEDDGSAPAYVIYTSGSTGRPKGVVVPHRNVAALLDATRPAFGLGPEDTWTLFHSSAFDFSVWEIWGCLLTGGRLVVVDHWTARDTDEFCRLLSRQRVTVLSQTPSAFAQLVRADREADLPLAVRLVVFGGEPLDVRMLQPWFTRHPPSRCRLVNMFGITETTVHVTAHTVTPADVVVGSRSVGRALPGWSLSVRDRHGRVLPPGVAGEICVGGAGVADRYLGRPELTAERFVRDPHGTGRLYRSGDLGRLREDGTLEHLGRLDGQVKVRGHRIEPDEIRHVLLSHPAVSAAAVVLRRDDPDDPATARLDGYVVLDGGKAAADTADVLAHARRVLPDYMVPASVTALDTIPLTVNGKLDAAALPEPVVTPAGRRTAPEGTPGGPEAREVPRGAGTGTGDDALGNEILKLWSHVLNTEVTPRDNFFELGGNSLLVIRLLREMRETGMPSIATRDFYRNSTAAQFIELVRNS